MEHLVTSIEGENHQIYPPKSPIQSQFIIATTKEMRETDQTSCSSSPHSHLSYHQNDPPNNENQITSLKSSPQQMNHLISGYKQFRKQYFENPKNTLFKDLVLKGQSPKVMVIACSDSRVDPSIILGSSPGELFVVRNVANLVPPCDSNPRHHGTSAALEFAVQTLQVSHIIVLGHSHCGGIRALLQQPQDPKGNNFISKWMGIADSVKQKVQKEYGHLSIEQQAKFCEEQSLLVSLQNLHGFPWINEKNSSGILFLHAWRFDLNTGIIQRFNGESNRFENLEPTQEPTDRELL